MDWMASLLMWYGMPLHCVPETHVIEPPTLETMRTLAASSSSYVHVTVYIVKCVTSPSLQKWLLRAGASAVG